LLFNTDEETQLNFFPVNNTNWVFTDTAVKFLLDSCVNILKDADFVKELVSLVWIKILDVIKERKTSFLEMMEVNEMCAVYSLSSDEIAEMLTFFYEMGILIWINEENLQDIVILDPIDYLVKPATMIICKHIATKDDPYHTVHCEKIHKVCRKDWPEDWFQMLQSGLVTERLVRRLLKSACLDDSHVDKVLLLMSRLNLSVVVSTSLNASDSNVYFVSALAPCEPNRLFPTNGFYRYRELLENLSARMSYVSDSNVKFMVVHFAFTNSFESLKHPLLSAHDIRTFGFLPDGLFVSFIGRLFKMAVHTVSDLPMFLRRNDFIAFKDIVKIRYLSRSIKIINLSSYNMIRIEIEKRSEDDNEKRTLMFLHDFLYVVIQDIIRECYKNLVVVTLLPIDQKDYQGKPLLPLTELKYLSDVSEGEFPQLTVDYNTKLPPIQRLPSPEIRLLKEMFHLWLGTATIHPEKDNYTNQVPFVFFPCCFS
jgi:hypothetical protein